MRLNQKAAWNHATHGFLNVWPLLASHWIAKILTIHGLVMASILSGSVSAAYVDPIDLPAVKYEAAPQALLIDITTAGERLVAVGERGTIVYSDDQGGSWTQADVETSAHLNAIVFVDDKNGWAVGEDAVILNTKDAGSSWQLQFDDRNADTQGPLLDVAFLNAHEGFAVGVFNKLVTTSDGGATWQYSSERVDNIDEWHLTGIAAGANGVIYISSEMEVSFRSVDSGQSFQPLAVPTIGTAFGLLVRQNAEGVDEIVMHGIGGSLYVSRDAAETWEQIETGTTLNILGGHWTADGAAVFAGIDGLVMHLDSGLTKAKILKPPFPAPFGSALAVGEKIVIVGFGGANLIDGSVVAGQAKAE